MTQFEASTTAADNRAFVVYHGNNEQIEFKGNGTANFAGSVDLSGITSDNSIVVNRTGANQTAYQANLNGVKKAEIKAGGAAEFAGTLTTGGTINAANTSAAGNGLIVGNSNQIVLQADGTATFTNKITLTGTGSIPGI